MKDDFDISKCTTSITNRTLSTMFFMYIYRNRFGNATILRASYWKQIEGIDKRSRAKARYYISVLM